jgi:hypothetical protein
MAKKSEIKVLDLYYADCIREKGGRPVWSTARTREQLTDEGSLNKVIKQAETLLQKRRGVAALEYRFGDEVIKVDHERNMDVRSILQALIALPVSEASLPEFQEWGDVLAMKYLSTPWSRTRLFMVTRADVDKKRYVFTIVADLKDEVVRRIRPKTLDFASQTIQNIYGDLKKGALYPAIVEGKRNEDVVIIFDSGRAKYYPRSLECILKLDPESEARALFGVLGKVLPGMGRSHSQIASIMENVRNVKGASIGYTELADLLGNQGIPVDRQELEKAWKKEYNYSNYKVPPGVLAQESVKITIKLDEFEITCPLIYYPSRIEYESNGKHRLTLTGYDTPSIKAGNYRIQLTDTPSTP